MRIFKALLKIYVFIILFVIFLGKYNRYDKDKAAAYATRHALSRSCNCCAWYVMKAIWAGGKPCIILPAFAYSGYLPLLGFDEVDTEGYVPRKGDIVVFPHVKGHIYGHIAMWNGKQWISDFKQKGLIVAEQYKECNYEVFRYSKENN